jgi:hypothetical protein
MDFITDLPLSRCFDAILVVVDRLTKMAHFIPCNKTATSADTARLVMDNVVRLHGLPDDIVSDRGPQFASRFWARLFALLGTKIKLSTAFHPQTDGQTERVNQILEQYLRCTINYHQNNWVSLLPLAEFAYNNARHASTGQSPFFANTGYHPRFGILPVQQPTVPAAEDHARAIQQLQAELKLQLAAAQARYKHQADQHRIPHPAYQIGELVWLLARNIKTTRPSKKLDNKRLGPYAINKLVSATAYGLALPPNSGLHDVFHVSLLEPYQASTIPGRDPEPPPPVVINGNEEYEVDEVLDSRFIRRKLHYLVSWKNYPISEASWEPVEHLAHALDLCHDYHLQNPDKPAKTSGAFPSKGEMVSRPH